MDKVDFNEDKILDALKRSGYLFESEISKTLSDNDFFVESNVGVIDKFTGKSREIDLIAEYNSAVTDFSKCHCKIKFVFEIKNTNSPIILLTEYQLSPNVESWEAIKEHITIPNQLQYYNDTLYDALIYKNDSIYTQYCGFQEKKGTKELMALHPDNIYTGIQKITQYCEENVSYDDSDRLGYLRHFIYLPILLISEDLYELKMDNNSPKIYKTEESSLIFNYHHNNEPKSCLVKVVTKQGFSNFITTMLSYERQIESEMIIQRKEQESRQN